MAVTRGANNITAPRAAYVPTSAPASRQTATKPKTKKKTTSTAKKPAATKANTSKPRAGRKPGGVAAKDKKTATGRVSKKAAAAAPKAKTVNKRDPSLMDKVQGVAEKIVGVIEGKPGKKVYILNCFFSFLSPSLPQLLRRRLRWGVSVSANGMLQQAAGTKKIKGTDGKGATRAKRG